MAEGDRDGDGPGVAVSLDRGRGLPGADAPSDRSVVGPAAAPVPGRLVGSSTCRPARSMASQATPDTPATTRAQASRPSPTRRRVLMGPLCQPGGPGARAVRPPGPRRRPYRDHVASLLLIEDDPGIRSTLARALAERGHAVDAASGGMAGLERALETGPDLVLLDLGLPDLDGATVLSMLRAVASTPVVVITARDDESQIVRRAGRRCRRLRGQAVRPRPSRRAHPRGAPPDHRGRAGRAAAGRRPQHRRTDARRHRRPGPGRRCPRRSSTSCWPGAPGGGGGDQARPFAEVWRQPYGGGDRTVDVHLSWLRRKLGETADRPRFLHSVRGVGVRLDDARPPVVATER